MILTGHQPNYLPNLAFFAKMQQADMFIVTTNLQMQKSRGWVRRNKIPGQHSDIWLTVPVHGSSYDRICAVDINNSLDWSIKHQRILQTMYGRSRGRDMLPYILEVLDRKWERLADLNWAYITLLASLLDIRTPLVLDEEIEGRRHEIVISTCKKYDASCYLAGAGGKLYVDDEYVEALKKEGIQFQCMGDDISTTYPYSTVHYLLAYGKEWVQNMLKVRSRKYA
jgi:hypothetical protein